MTRAGIIGAAVAITVAAGLTSLAVAGEPGAQAPSPVSVESLTVPMPATPDASSSTEPSNGTRPEPSGRPTPVAPPAAPPVPLDSEPGRPSPTSDSARD